MRFKAASFVSPKLASKTSKVTFAPTCVNTAPSKSKPSASAGQSSGDLSQMKRASGSMKRRISQALASRSIHGRRRVAQIRCGNPEAEAA